MIKVLIVDDEYIIREGMKLGIDWAAMGCVICGDAADAEEGIEIAMRENPDIIITDICMTQRTGLDMCREIKGFNKECKILVVSGYDQLDYAKEAIKLGVEDYILKPIEEEELETIVKKMVKDISAKKDRIFIAKEKIILDMLRGKIRGEETIRELVEIYNFSMDTVQIVSIQNEFYKDAFETGNFEVFYRQNEMLKNLLEEYFEEEKTCVIESHENVYALVIDGDVDREFIIKGLKEIQEKMKDEFDIVLTIGCSNNARIEDIRHAYRDSKRALKNRVYKGLGTINVYEEIREENKIKWKNIIHIENRYREALREGKSQKGEACIEEIFNSILKESYVDYDAIIRITKDMISMGYKILSEKNISLDKIFSEEIDPIEKIARYSTLDEIYDFMKSFTRDIINEIKIQNSDFIDSGIDKVIEFIRENYKNNISLSDVAKHVYLSESYISRKIKKVIGISFTEYVTKLRIEEALILMKDNKYRVSEIASLVGYSDYRYFSRTFKKYTGKSPRDMKQ